MDQDIKLIIKEKISLLLTAGDKIKIHHSL